MHSITGPNSNHALTKEAITTCFFFSFFSFSTLFVQLLQKNSMGFLLFSLKSYPTLPIETFKCVFLLPSTNFVKECSTHPSVPSAESSPSFEVTWFQGVTRCFRKCGFGEQQLTSFMPRGRMDVSPRSHEKDSMKGENTMTI